MGVVFGEGSGDETQRARAGDIANDKFSYSLAEPDFV